jgi:hypothetical protein
MKCRTNKLSARKRWVECFEQKQPLDASNRRCVVMYVLIEGEESQYPKSLLMYVCYFSCSFHRLTCVEITLSCFVVVQSRVVNNLHKWETAR